MKIVLKSRVRESADYSEETKCLVKFVDYGNLDIIPLSSLRHIDSDMKLVLETPFLAVRYRMAYMKPLSKVPKPHTIQLFNENPIVDVQIISTV